MGRPGRFRRDAAATAAHPQSGRTHADRHHGLRKSAGVPRTWNFDALAGGRTRSDAQATQITSFVTMTTPAVLPWPQQVGFEAAPSRLISMSCYAPYQSPDFDDSSGSLRCSGHGFVNIREMTLNAAVRGSRLALPDACRAHSCLRQIWNTDLVRQFKVARDQPGRP